MDERYSKSIHRTGRIGLIIGIAFMLGIPAVTCMVFDVWPKSVAEVMTVGAGLLAVFIPTAIAEVFAYTPVLGSSAYITFLTGNVSNLKLPVVINAQTLTDTTQGTDEGDTIAAIGVAISSIVTTLIIVAGVILMVPLKPILTSNAVQTATTYLLPSLFGGIFLSYMSEECGEYIAKNKPLTAVVPLILVFVVNAFYPLSGKEGFVVIACMVLNVICAYALYKMGVIKMIPKTSLKKDAASAEHKKD